jgi:uncharacterized protein
MARRQDGAGRRGELFDAFDLVVRKATLTGTVSTAGSLPRAADRLVSDGAARLAWRIAGREDAQGRPALEVTIDGVVTMTCQRCLEPFALPVAQRTLLLLARDERELAALDDEDEHEVVLAEAALDARTLVEDEVLLTLPFAPHCERGACRAPSLGDAAAGTATGSAFAKLAGLKRGDAKKARD